MLSSLRGVPEEFPEVASKYSQFEVSGCKRVTHFTCNEVYKLLRFDAMTGEREITSGVTYLDYLGEEFFAMIEYMRTRAVERVIVGFN